MSHLKEERVSEEQLQNRVLICVDCSEEFVFTVQAQEYFKRRGFFQSPKRCKSCHAKHKRERRAVGA